MESTCHIDGFGPLPVVRPASVAELGEVVRRASTEGSAIYPIGGQTQLALGNPPIKPGMALDVRGLDQVVDFPARDMTITVQAGINVDRLQRLAAAEKLRLPIDVPRAEQATLGGIIATNISGPHRYGFGTLRDYVIGISAVNDDGQEFKAGGRVVKNVAGYDMCKLLVGSLGTLGIITQVTLKLRPLAEDQVLLTLGFPAEGLPSLLDALHATRTRPVCIDVLNRASADAVLGKLGMMVPETPWTLAAGFEGNEEAVRWQMQQLVAEIGAPPPLEARVGFTTNPLWAALTELVGGGDAMVGFKANMLPSAVAAFCNAVDREPNRPLLQAHAGNGIVHGHWAELSEARAAELRAAWRVQAAKGQGSVVVTRCPSAWKRSVPVWDSIPDGWLMRTVKEKFDPRRTFNPGRFVDGI